MHGMSEGDVWEEQVCADESAAKHEAARRSAADPEGAEWIYLHNEHEQWVARRIPPDWSPPEPKPERWATALLHVLFDPSGWGSL
jgi:hypothetical protein